MRNKSTHGPLSVHAIAGNYVVLLGIDMAEDAAGGLLGFAIERADLTEDERYWLYGFKTFEGADVAPGTPASTLEHPLQTFFWGDYTAKPAHSYRYRVVAMRGEPESLRQGEAVEVEIATEDPDAGAHEVYFNRGAAGSQAYARKFGNRPPHEVENGEAWAWLSRGLEEALLAFVGRARGDRYALRAAVYEFQYPKALEAFGEAAESGADVRIVFDAKQNADDYPNGENREAIGEAGIGDLCVPREATKSYIAHNKFVVLLEDGEPREVWTGSTNLTGGGIFGHSNVGHVVRDRAVAAKYLSYWEELAGDPEAGDLRPWTEGESPVPDEFAPGTTAVFSPRASLAALERYAELMDASESAVFLTAAFGVNDLLEGVLGRDRDYLRYVLLEKEDEDMEIISRDPDNRFAVGGTIRSTDLGRRLQEEALTGLNTHVKYVHTKYLLVDPLGDDPPLVTGSANFSNASTRNNAEKMPVIRGAAAVADVYLGEFMRLFNHFYVRNLAARQRDPEAARGAHLSPDDSWRLEHYREGPKKKERLYFAG